MLSVIDFRSGDLAPTKTYGRRCWCFIPADREHPEWDRSLGRLTLKLQPSHTGWGRKIEIDTYAIEEQDAIPGLPGRVFLLVNLSDDSQEQPYECVIGPQSRCTCTAARCRVPGYDATAGCKHRDVLRHLIDEGILDDETPDWQRSGRWIEEEVAA